MALAKIRPDAVFLIPEDERQHRVSCTSDLCAVDDAIFLVRAVLEIPVRDTDATFEFGVWGSVSRVAFNIYSDEFDNPAPAFGPFACYLGSSLPLYPSIFDSEPSASLHFRSGNLRPLFRLDASDHPLSIDQHEGITVDRLTEIYAAWGHTVVLQ